MLYRVPVDSCCVFVILLDGIPVLQSITLVSYSASTGSFGYVTRTAVNMILVLVLVYPVVLRCSAVSGTGFRIICTWHEAVQVFEDKRKKKVLLVASLGYLFLYSVRYILVLAD